MANMQTTRHPLAYRILHQAMMAAILLLVITGLYIHRPFIADGWGFFMSLMRGVHFFAAAVLIITVVLRILGMFFGRNRDWPSFIPNRTDLKLLPKVINYYAYLGPEVETKKKYNPLQMITYSLVFVLAIFQIITGFILLYPDGWLSFINYGLFGNEINTRIAHDVVTWLFILFLMIHVYLTIRESFEEMKEVHLMRSAEGTEELGQERSSP